MKLYRAYEVQAANQYRATVLIYAESEQACCDYLKTLPLFWDYRWKPELFQEVVPPKGPSPSVLMYCTKAPYRGD